VGTTMSLPAEENHCNI